MPITHSSFAPSFLVKSPTIQTILPALFRSSRIDISYKRQRICLPDGDFIDFDYYPSRREKLAIISHGLEGKSQARYVRGMAKLLLAEGYDVVAWNMRGCSGELNKLLPSYHSGLTQDLRAVIDHVRAQTRIADVLLVGFSVGGNLTLKLLGELGEEAASLCHAAITFSVPINLGSSAHVLALPRNRVYMDMFLRSLLTKLRAKEKRTPGALDLSGVDKIRTFREFDNRFIAPLFGFKDAEDYWEKASSEPYIPRIRVPTLLLTSRDDPFLDPKTLPITAAENSKFFHLEVSDYGGHVGFMKSSPWHAYYSEESALRFINLYGVKKHN